MEPVFHDMAGNLETLDFGLGNAELWTDTFALNVQNTPRIWHWSEISVGSLLFLSPESGDSIMPTLFYIVVDFKSNCQRTI